MACAPHTCTNHDTGTTTCFGHRASCPTNRPATLSVNYGVVDGAVLASDINNLRVNIRDELARWDIRFPGKIYYQAAAYIANTTPIQAQQVSELDNMVGQVTGGNTVNIAGDPIDAAHWAALLGRYDTMRTNCICNADCSCNAICACYGNCGCNYSDERLKEDIVWL